MTSRNKNKKLNMLSVLIGSNAFGAKFLVSVSPLLFLQGVTSSGPWEKIINISLAVFVMAVGGWLLYKEYKKETAYSKTQHEITLDLMRDQQQELHVMIKEYATLTEKVVSSNENSTQAMKSMTNAVENMTRQIEKMNNRLENVEDGFNA